jgi:hypothetical protein
MDNRHQSEREYIRYHAATSGEHLVAGIHGLAHGKFPVVGLRKNGSSATVPHKCLCTHLKAWRKKKTVLSTSAKQSQACSRSSSSPPGIKPMSLHMLGKCCTTKVHIQP